METVLQNQLSPAAGAPGSRSLEEAVRAQKLCVGFCCRNERAEHLRTRSKLNRPGLENQTDQSNAALIFSNQHVSTGTLYRSTTCHANTPSSILIRTSALAESEL
jgi:hypothetical protein